MTRGRPDYRTLDHTADAAIELEAPDLPGLLERATLAMFDLMVDVETIATAGPPSTVRIVAHEPALQLVGWLGEVLSLAMVRGEVYGAAAIDACSAEGVAGRVWGEPLDQLRHRFRSELKAVTYHHLLVEPTVDGWHARMVFDI